MAYRRNATLRAATHRPSPLRNSTMAIPFTSATPRPASHRIATQRNVSSIGTKTINFISNPELQAEIAAIAERLRMLSIGETASYAELSDAAGREVQHAARISLMRARRLVETEDGSRFATVVKTGVKRMTAEEIPEIGAIARRKTNRVAKRAYERLSGISANNITTETERRIMVERAHLGAIVLVTKDAAHKKTDAAVTTATAEVPAAKLLQMFTQ